MRVSDAVKSWADVLGTEIEIEGVAEITNSFSMIYEEEDRTNREVGDSISPGILVHGDQLRVAVESLPKPIAGYGGSEVAYLVKVRVIGVIANTGRAFAPLKFGHIYEIEFDDEFAGVQKLTLNTRLVDVSFRIVRPLQASEVKQFKHFFPSIGNLVELKKYLESGKSILLIRRVTKAEVGRHVQFLTQINAEYELRESPIENGLWGVP